MVLAYMLNVCEDDFICDIAETYHIYDIYALNADYIATLASGLRSNSRAKMTISGDKLSLQDTLLALMVDHLSVLIWQNTSDGHKGINHPVSVYETLTDTKENDYAEFKSGEEFKKAWNDA